MKMKMNAINTKAKLVESTERTKASLPHSEYWDKAVESLKKIDLPDLPANRCYTTKWQPYGLDVIEHTEIIVEFSESDYFYAYENKATVMKVEF